MGSIPNYTRFRSTTVTNTATSVRSDAADLFGWNIINQDAVNAITVKLYNIAAAGVTVGTSEVIESIYVPAGQTAVLRGDERAVRFDTALSVAVTTESADNGNTAPATLPIISLYID